MPTGLILQPTYQIRDQRPVVQLFGRLDDGPTFLVEDDRFQPYLFVHVRDVASLGPSIDATARMPWSIR